MKLKLYVCVHKRSDGLRVALSCDTARVTYQAIVQPILSANCYSCHSTIVTENGGLDLENFASLKQYLNYDFRGDGIYGSKFYHCITHSLNALPMPPSYKIDTCDSKKILIWLEHGAQDN